MDSTLKGPKIGVGQIPQLRSDKETINLDIEVSIINSLDLSPRKYQCVESKSFEKNVTSETSTKRNNRKMTSSFIKVMISDTIPTFKKIAIFWNKILLIHFFVILFTISKILIQNNVNRYCWLPGVCLCGDDFQIKIYSTFSYILMFFNLVILTISQTLIEVLIQSTFRQTLIGLLFYFICFFFTFFYLMRADEVTLETYPIIFGYLCLVPIFQLQLLRRTNYNLKLWLAGMMRMNSINYLIFGNYILCRSILPKFGEYLRDSVGFYHAKNLMSLTNFIYFAIYTVLFQKCIYIYYDFMKFLKITDPKTIIIVIRFCLTFAVGVPVSSVINMDFEDWGSWLMLFSYAHFLFSFYTRMNV